MAKHKSINNGLSIIGFVLTGFVFTIFDSSLAYLLVAR